MKVKDLSHQNLNGFIGVCLDQTMVYILKQYCSRGSLQVRVVMLMWQSAGACRHIQGSLQVRFVIAR